MIERRPSGERRALLLYTATACFLFSAGWCATAAQETQQKPAAESPTKPTEKGDKPEEPAHPAQIELLETKVRFETNGDSRKEVHALVKINSELGVRQFAQLNFDFNRSFETVEMPMVHITHANGGTSDILPSAITDHPNPAVVNFPAYQDVRVKSVRILGLEPGDTLEYRVVRTVSHHPLAPDFWLEHSFDRSGVVSHEIFELDLPASRFEEDDAAKSAQLRDEEQLRALPLGLVNPWQKDSSILPARIGAIYVSPQTPENLKERVKEADVYRLHYRWSIARGDLGKQNVASSSGETSDPDIVVTSFFGWEAVAWAFNKLCYSQLWNHPNDPAISLKRKELLEAKESLTSPEEAFYEFVSEKIKTVDLPLELAGFSARPPSETLASGYGTPADKVTLFRALLSRSVSCGVMPRPLDWHTFQFPRPSLFAQLIVEVPMQNRVLYLDPSLEIAPFGMIPSSLRGRDVLMFLDPPRNLLIQGPHPQDYFIWKKTPVGLPFSSMQRVSIDASLSLEGKLSARVKYAMRGDNELVLRVAFHKSPKERWKELAQLLSITDGFRGQVTSVNASDPYATKEPFTVEYELDQPKFVDWSKKPLRIPALLPQLGLPDPPAKPVSGSAMAPIDLGTPLEVETKMTLHLPPGTTASAPAGTSVERDYATYSSLYAVNGSTLMATRRIKFALREVPAARLADYNAFLRAVQNDESQDFTLVPPNNPAPKTNSAAPNAATPPKPATPKP